MIDANLPAIFFEKSRHPEIWAFVAGDDSILRYLAKAGTDYLHLLGTG